MLSGKNYVVEKSKNGGSVQIQKKKQQPTQKKQRKTGSNKSQTTTTTTTAAAQRQTTKRKAAEDSGTGGDDSTATASTDIQDQDEPPAYFRNAPNADIEFDDDLQHLDWQKVEPSAEDLSSWGE